jgi:ADP-heptose:LPS heptosyltransferase
MIKTKRAVVIKYGFLGDSIVCIPFLVSLNRTHSIDLITIDWMPSSHSLNAGFIFKSMGLVEGVFVIKREIVNVLRFILRNRRRYDDCFNLLPSLGCLSDTFYLVIGRQLAKNYYTRSSHSSLPEVIDLLSLAPFSLNYKELLRNTIVNFCKNSTLDINLGLKGNLVIGVQPFSKMSSKQYDLGKFTAILYKIHVQNSVEFVFLGTKAEYLSWNCDLVEYLGNSTLEDLFLIISRIDIYFGVDTGAMHIADLMEKRIVALFSDRTRSRNWYPAVSSMVSIHRTYRPCGGCNLAECVIGNECLNFINESEVIEALNSFCHA